MDKERQAKIASLNDAFRKSGSGIVLTQGVQDLYGKADLMDTVCNFEDFNGDNDPYHEHDFGSLEWKGQKIFWKIDYYDQAMQYGEDPLSPDCKRVLTVMLASEY
jgi:hypothetical protein